MQGKLLPIGRAINAARRSSKKSLIGNLLLLLSLWVLMVYLLRDISFSHSVVPMLYPFSKLT